MLILERVAKAIFHVPGIAKVQSITRPLGTPLDHSSIPFQLSQQSVGQVMNLGYQRDRAADLLRQSGELRKTINLLQQQYDLRDKIATFDDFFRPIRSYFYWEQHCYDIPACWALRSIFDAIDGIDKLTEQFQSLTASLDKLDSTQSKLLKLLPPQIASQETNLELTLSNYATNSGINNQSTFANDNPAALGQAFDKSKNDDSFYLPPEVFSNADFQRGLKLFVSPGGTAARMIVTHKGDPATPEGISHIDPIRQAADEAVKGTPLEGANLYITGTAATAPAVSR